MIRTDATPAELAKFVHRVPQGAVIPAGTEYVWRMTAGYLVLQVDEFDVEFSIDYPHWTREPIKLPLPTKPLSVITDVLTIKGERYPLGVRAANEWLVSTANGYTFLCYAEDIASFTPAHIIKDGES